jgi:Uma2 family endonuclease
MLLRRGALPKTETASVPPLYAGDHLSQPEFHRRYEQYTDDVKIELINGTVYMASPQRLPHGRYTTKLASLLDQYEAQTPGVEAANDSTVFLGPKSEPRPDLFLRVLTGLGGNTRTVDEYVYGGPELIIEVAHSTVAIDLHQKKDDYERCGVAEYLVVCLEERQVCWFDLAGRRTHSVPADGILRSKRFPGLWIDTQALFRGDSKRLGQILNEGLASPEHARFVRRLGKAAEVKAKPKKRPRKNGQ